MTEQTGEDSPRAFHWMKFRIPMSTYRGFASYAATQKRSATKQLEVEMERLALNPASTGTTSVDGACRRDHYTMGEIVYGTTLDVQDEEIPELLKGGMAS